MAKHGREGAGKRAAGPGTKRIRDVCLGFDDAGRILFEDAELIARLKDWVDLGEWIVIRAYGPGPIKNPNCKQSESRAAAIGAPVGNASREDPHGVTEP